MSVGVHALAAGTEGTEQVCAVSAAGLAAQGAQRGALVGSRAKFSFTSPCSTSTFRRKAPAENAVWSETNPCEGAASAQAPRGTQQAWRPSERRGVP